MREFFRSRFFKVILLVLALLLGFMVYAISQNGFSTVSSQIIGTVSAPFQKLSSYLSETATDFFGKFVDAEATAKQNDELRDELAALRDQMVDYGDIKRENEVLKEQLGLKQEHPDWQSLAASVVARDPADELLGAFTIDKGAYHGVGLRDAVVTKEGLVGVVTEVGQFYCKVTTILSPELKIGAVETTTGEIGTVTGTIALAGQNSCELGYLSQNSQIKAGDIISTSGAGGIFPKGIIIGIAEAPRMAEHGITASLTVKPALDIKEVTQVFVITGFEGKSEDGAAQ